VADSCGNAGTVRLYHGQFAFNGQYTGSGFADFLLGYAIYNETAIQDSGHWADNSFAGYFQDN
jgi:hypothetical protein